MAVDLEGVPIWGAARFESTRGKLHSALWGTGQANRLWVLPERQRRCGRVRWWQWCVNGHMPERRLKVSAGAVRWEHAIADAGDS